MSNALEAVVHTSAPLVIGYMQQYARELTKRQKTHINTVRPRESTYVPHILGNNARSDLHKCCCERRVCQMGHLGHKIFNIPSWPKLLQSNSLKQFFLYYFVGFF